MSKAESNLTKGMPSTGASSSSVSEPRSGNGKRASRRRSPADQIGPHTSWWSKLPTMIRRGIVLVVLIAFWQVYVSVKHVSPLVFSSPSSTVAAFIDGWRNGEIAHATATTLEVLIGSMIVAVAIGVLFTIIAITTTIGKDFVMLMTSMINPLPSIAILPLAIVWFGLNNRALVFVTVLGTVWPITINVTTGFSTVNSTLLMAGRNLGLKGWRLVKDVLLPAALPDIMSGIKVGWAFSWRTVIAAELIFGTAGGSGGLGYYINTNDYFLKIPEVFAGLVTIAIIGIIVESLLNVLERNTTIRWGMQQS